MPKDKIIAFIDFFYPPFRRFMPEQTFRYAACGGFNTLLSITIFNVFNKFIFKETPVDIGFLVLKSHNAALFISFCVSFIVGFLLLKFLVFVGSTLRGRIQLFRYFLAYVVNLILSYFFMMVLVEYLHIDAFIAQLITTGIVIAISYLSQKNFTFSVKKANKE
jgi:putative flippase GtrA